MRRKQHVIVTETLFGDGYDEVHAWLDATYRPYLGFAHWINRHHVEAIAEQFGDGTVKYQVAEFHIMCDWFQHLRLNFLPETAKEVEEILTDLMLI